MSSRSSVIGAGLLLCAAGGTLWRWKRRRLAELSAGSELVETDRGVVEVARRSSGYSVLVLHGAPGGYDQGLLLDGVLRDDVEIIAPSRPGFLRTPLDDHRSFEDQSSLLVALLDALDVNRPIVVGLSCGGPVALQLAAEYPERVTGLVLASSITTPGLSTSNKYLVHSSIRRSSLPPHTGGMDPTMPSFTCNGGVCPSPVPLVSGPLT